MAIQVICPGCHKRFSVSDKFAGQQGACPECKGIINVPKASDEIVVHAPEDSGPKDSQGRSVLKPLKRQATRLSIPLIVAIVVGLLVTFLGAIIFQGTTSPVLLGIGGILLGPILGWAGYSFLREAETEPFGGLELLARNLGCGLIFAAGWGVVWGIDWYLDLPEFAGVLKIFYLALLLGIGTVAATVAYELELFRGALCYAVYLGVTVVLRLIVGLPAIGSEVVQEVDEFALLLLPIFSSLSSVL
ncbi:MAG: hypothetical protein MPJ24_09165 [Pirellulaceae bacterium]|nr:hypothetical protein [Pirellulaceae bacterium]